MVNWRLSAILEENSITPYRLAEEVRGRVSRNSIYAIANAKTERVDLSTLSALLDGLRKLTGKSYSVGDLLEYHPD